MGSRRTGWPRWGACAAALVAATTLLAGEERTHELMPVPVSVELSDEGFPLAGRLTVAVVGPANDRLERAVERLAARLAARLERPFEAEVVDDPSAASVVVQCPGTLVGTFPSLEDDESYRLGVGRSGVRLEAPGPLGVLRGLPTLAQLVAEDEGGWVLRGAVIEDRPRFPWRGLMIDVVRHWQPLEVIERNLDAMEAVKLNVLHLHLTDDQGFRVESRTYPRLHELGSGGRYFTREEMEHLIAYAADRGIRVVPELDMPGHATSWLVAYPELESRPEEDRELARGLGVFHNALDPTREETYAFLDRLLGEMAGLFPDDYLHVGGDEVSGASWSEDRIVAFMNEHGLEGTRGLQAHFTERVLEIVARHGKTAVGWDEIAHGEVRTDTVIQLWLPDADPGASRSLVSTGFYLDHMLSAGAHYANEPLDALPSGEARAKALGGEACLWTEFVTPAILDSRIWPRTAAIAERLWSPPERRNVEDMYRRLETVGSDLTRLGLEHETYYEPALARLTGGELKAPLETLADVTTPPNILERIFSPQALGAVLVPSLAGPADVEVGRRFEDVLQPESEAGRAFGKAVDLYLDAPSAARRQAVEEPLRLWRENHEELVALLEAHPDLEEIEPLSAGLRELAEMGLGALGVLEGGPPFSEREKRRHLERLALYDPRPLDLRSLEAPEGEEVIDALPAVIGGLLLERLKSFEPLIIFRVKIAVQPGVQALVLAAHREGTRDEGVLAGGWWWLYDRKGRILVVLALMAFVALVVRRRRSRQDRGARRP